MIINNSFTDFVPDEFKLLNFWFKRKHQIAKLDERCLLNDRWYSSTNDRQLQSIIMDVDISEVVMDCSDT